MPLPLFHWHALTPLLLLAGGALAALASVLGGIAALSQHNPLSPGRRALACWIPIAVTTTLTTLLGHTNIAIGVIFGTTVAALSGVAGLVALSGPVSTIPPAAARNWALLPTTTLLAFIAGLQGNLGIFEATILILQGLLLISLWTQTPHPHDPSLLPQNNPRPLPLRAAMLLPILAAASLSAWATVRGAEALALYDPRFSSQAIAATILSVALVLPMVGTGAALAAHAHAWVPLTAHVGVAYLNLCALLPLVILLPSSSHWIAGFSPTTLTNSSQNPWPSVVFPRMAWRIDALAALILSLVFMTIASGRLRFDRTLATGLILAYFLYLLSTLATSLAA